ncbi:hypothetical protein RTG_00795 [Rhodotorula toruloides ATCC 204091]|uniref:Uncharacterized protein n=1 Tax=Rhodotorula toruloides TaxID=5286 RepID=A0A0K3CDI3_RHOTO|nr:hypothetical protein RTG_00795 [Rhodotorula toruloides ATCC 204091]
MSCRRGAGVRLVVLCRRRLAQGVQGGEVAGSAAEGKAQVEESESVEELQERQVVESEQESLATDDEEGPTSSGLRRWKGRVRQAKLQGLAPREEASAFEVSAALSPPPRRYGGPPSPVYRRHSPGPPRGYGPPGRGRDFSRSPPPPSRRYPSPGPPSRRRSRSPPPPGYRSRRRSISRSPPVPPSHAPFSARSAKREFIPDEDEEDDMIFRKARRASHADSGGRARSRTPLSPSPPASRGRSPSPFSGPPSRRRSPSPRGGSYRHRPRSPSPQSLRSGRNLPPSVPTGPRGFRPITAQQPPAASDGPAIPTGPRSRFPQQPPRGPAALNKPAGPGGLPAIPTGPKAWRTSMIVPQGPTGPPSGPSSARQREPSPPPRRQHQEEQPSRRRSAESPANTPPPPRPSAAREPSPPPASASTPAPPSHVTQLSHTKPVAPTPPPPPAPLSPAATAALAADREARLAQIESQRRLKMLARFLPRGAGGSATIQPLAKAVVVGPIGAEWEAEITRQRAARLALLPAYADALAASYKSDYSIIATLKEAEIAREVRKLASGEVKPVFEDEDVAMAADLSVSCEGCEEEVVIGLAARLLPPRQLYCTRVSSALRRVRLEGLHSSHTLSPASRTPEQACITSKHATYPPSPPSEAPTRSRRLLVSLDFALPCANSRSLTMGEDANKLVVTAHADGPAHLTFAPDGRYLYTSGYEGFIRIFDARLDADANAEPAIVDFHEEAVTSISATTEYLCSASESGQVVLHQAGKTDLDGFLTRFSLPARSVRFDPRGRRAVVTSDEVIAKVVDVKEPTKVQILTGHARSIREASWSPDGQLVTTSSTDGQIRVWQLDGGTEPTCIQVLDGLIKAEDADSEYSCEVVWHPAGKFFVVPSKDSGEITIVSRETWQKTGTFSSRDGHTGRISAVAFSTNGLYLASASDDLKDILVWSVKDRTIVFRTPHTHGMITCLAFHPAPTANSLAYIDNKGQLTRWEGAVPSGLPLPTYSKPPASTTSTATAGKSATVNGGGRKRSDSASTSTSSHAGGARGGKGLFRKEASEDEFDDLDDGALDGWIDDDLGDGALDGLDPRGMSVDPFADDVPIPPKRGEGRSRSLAPLLGGEPSRTKLVEKGQPPFQPGATKWREDRRYLAFNMIGYIYAVDRHDDGQAVTIEFHDRSAHIASKFDDKMKYNLAALGELGAIFSCPSAGDSPSQLFYKPYESWTALQTWSASLPAGEQATALAIGGMGPATDGSAAFDDPTVGLTGSGTILVATSRGFVRFFSGAGLQKYIWNVGEEVVAMAAGKDWAAVVYRAGAGAGLDYSLIDTDTYEVVQQGKVPLSKGATLAWLGFTSDNVIPVMYDSKGLISVLDRSRRPRQGRWLPALDTNALPRKEGKQESYWLVGVTDQQAHVIILKGGEKEPHFPTPLLQEFDLQFPLLNLDVPQGQLAEKYLRESLFVQHRKDGAPAEDYSLKTELARQEVQTDKHLLQIIQTFCKADKLEAALDAVLLLSQPASLIAAAKIAAFFDLPSLGERIELLQQMREDAGDPDEANAKRQSKWAHLADDRFITSAPVGGAARSFGTPGAAAAHLFGPGGGHANNDHSFSPRPSGSSAFGSARRAFGTPASVGPSSSSKKRKSLQGPSALAGSDGAMQEDDDDALEYADEMVEEDEPASSPKRMRVDSEEIQIEETQESAPAPKKAVNPFAKRASNAKPSASHAANPFADKKAGKAKDLGRTDSFFHRVEGKEAPKAKGKGRAAASSTTATASAKSKPTTTGGKQMTLFGLPPGKEPEKKTKKRKSTADEAEEDAAATADSTASSSKKKLGAFRKKPGTAATAGLGAEAARELPREDEEMEETQIVDETQQDEESLPAPPAKRRDSELEAVREEQEEEAEDTQMSETQVETQVEEDPESLKENTRPPSSAAPDAASKLAQFAYKKPDVVPEVATPPAEAVQAAEESATAD